MTLILMVVTSVLVGWLAQVKKGRTGAFWGFLTMVILAPTWFVLYLGTAMVQPGLYKADEAWWALAILVCGLIGIAMALIVASLPKRSNP